MIPRPRRAVTVLPASYPFPTGLANDPDPDREPLPKRDPGKTLRDHIYASDAPTCCGSTMGRDGDQYVCGQCGAWYQAGLTAAAVHQPGPQVLTIPVPAATVRAADGAAFRVGAGSARGNH